MERIRTPDERHFPVLPTLLTLGNAFCGFAAITYAAKLGPEQMHAADGYLRLSAMYIFAGMLFDALDGPVARWTNQQSEFGAQLDSLCDAVTFGIAPAFLLRQFSAHAFLHPRLLWGVAALFVVCAILRLARFNTETEDDSSDTMFDGLPSMAAAAVVASFPIAMKAIQRWSDPGNPSVSAWVRQISGWLNLALVELLPVVALLAAWLMVTQFRYPHVFKRMFRETGSRRYVVQSIIGVLCVFLIGELAVLLICCWFAFATPASFLWGRFVPCSPRQKPYGVTPR